MRSVLSLLTTEEIIAAVQRKHKDWKSPYIYEYVSRMLGFRPKRGAKNTITRQQFYMIFGGKGGATAYDSDAQAFIDRGTFTDDQQTIINQFVLDLKTGLTNGNNLWTDVFTGHAIYPIIGGTAVNHSLNLMGTDFGITWINSPTHSSTGVLLNGSSQYGQTGYIPFDNLSAHNASISSYNSIDMVGTTEIMGSISGSNRLDMYENVGNISFVGHRFAQVASSGAVTTEGLVVGSVRGNNDREVYLNNTSVATNTGSDPGIQPTTHDVWVGTVNIGGSPFSFYSGELRLNAIGLGMTTSQAQDWYAAVNAFQTSLSRNV